MQQENVHSVISNKEQEQIKNETHSLETDHLLTKMEDRRWTMSHTELRVLPDLQVSLMAPPNTC